MKFAYSSAVATIGVSGHSSLGLNSDGFFGITAPRWDAARDLLLAGRGLLVLTPILVMAVVGIVLMYRRGHRAEALAIGGVTLALLPLQLRLLAAVRRRHSGAALLDPCAAVRWRSASRSPTGGCRSTTLALALPSALWMLAASLTYPLIGEQGTGLWVDWLADGRIEHTLLTALGVHSNWVATVPVLAAVALAAGLACAATPRPAVLARHDLWIALAALGGWLVVSTFGPSLAYDPATPLDGSSSSFVLIGASALAALAAIAVLYYRARERAPAERRAITAELALGDRTS